MYGEQRTAGTYRTRSSKLGILGLDNGRVVGAIPAASSASRNRRPSAPGGTRTPNRLIRSQLPYPLGHRRVLQQSVYRPGGA